MSSVHQRAKEVFIAALDLSPAERQAFIAGACGDDAELRREAESLLEFHEEEAFDEDITHAGAPTLDDLQLGPGHVIADRYRLTRRIGRGGMGDVWEATDLVLLTPVALKFIGSADRAARHRIANEVRLARQITHPAVCRVFDVGETDRGLFYSMELVRGEDLATLLRRAGRLRSDKVVDIARQLCAGLAAAHAQGVLHRDLKPANVLIDDDGLVRITDFGIAILRGEADLHLRTGTPRYMAPEQRVPGVLLSERTDVYSLGLVLYELLVGSEVFGHVRAGHALPGPSSLVPDVDDRLERVILEAVSIDPVLRPASALDMAAALPGSAVPREVSLAGIVLARTPASRWWTAAMALGAVVGLVALASSYFISPAGRTLTGQDTIVLADFDNATDDPVFDGALKVALAVALEQSPFLKVFPDDRARDTLRLMQRAPDERVTRAVAREIARREQLKALLAGSIASLGRNYVVTLEAVNAETGDVMAREQAEASSKEQVLTSLGAATSKMRERLGESLASIQKFDVPLPRATTASLDALHAYSLALSNGAEVPRLEAIPQLQRAIELDPGFAMAHAFLSGVYANTRQSALAPEHSRQAFELRDRVSERERFFISWRYYRDAVQDWEKALELTQTWTATYPREAVGFNALGIAYLRLWKVEESIPSFREAIRLDPKFVPSYGNLAASLLAADQFEDARAVLQQAADRRLDFVGARRLSYFLAFLQGDRESMARELDASVGVGQTNDAFGWQAHTSASAGQVRAAHDQYRRGIQLSMQGDFAEVAAQLTMEDAEMHAVMDQCADARRDVAAGLALSRDNTTLERGGRALALCGDGVEALSLSSEVGKRFPEATLTNRVSVPLIAAALAIRQRQPERAIAALDPVRRYEKSPTAEFWPAYLRGEAYLQLKNAAMAAAEFDGIVAHRGAVPGAVVYPLAWLGRARAAVLAGQVEEARSAYERLFALWTAADQDLAPLAAARGEYARLLRSSSPD